MPHAIERFRAPTAIRSGVSLAALLGRRAIALLAESVTAVVPGFAAAAFRRTALRELAGLGLMQRAAHIAAALRPHLADEPTAALRQVTAALGPPLVATVGNGLRPFFYLPHSSLIGSCATTAFTAGMEANYHLTSRFSAEFSIRPYLVHDAAACLRLLQRWARDPDPHVRRLVSEGTRPRLPWGLRLQAFVADPTPLLPLLEALKDDPQRYVTRSVANHLGDIAKDHLDLVCELGARWLHEAGRRGVPERRAAERRWLIRHALRHPAKQGAATALALRRAAA